MLFSKAKNRIQLLVASSFLSLPFITHAAQVPQNYNSTECPSASVMQTATPVASLPYAFNYEKQQLEIVTVSSLDIPDSQESWAVLMLNLPISPEQNFMSQTAIALSNVSAVYPKTNNFQVLNSSLFNDDDEQINQAKYTFQYCIYRAENAPRTTVLAIKAPSYYNDDRGLGQNKKNLNSTERLKRLQRDIRLAKMLLSATSGMK